jgi:hypothetical protein
MKTIKTIDVNAKEWFDKVNGNSYFAATITINYGMDDEETINLPFQYGYGDHYRDMAFEELKKAGYFANVPDNESYWRVYKENNIIARHSKQENCKKRDLRFN